jgi:CRISPR-associated protein Cst2
MNIANMEQHRSLNRYSIAIDLERLGTEKDEIGTHISPNTGIKADDPWFKQAEKQLRELEAHAQTRCLRVQQFLEIVKTLHRLIRGRVESLSPLFIIGGVYDCQNPFFMNAIRVVYEKGLPRVVLGPLKQILESKYAYGANMTEKLVRASTYMGIRDEYFANSMVDVGKKLFPASSGDGYDRDRVLSPEGMLDKVKQEVTLLVNSS